MKKVLIGFLACFCLIGCAEKENDSISSIKSNESQTSISSKKSLVVTRMNRISKLTSTGFERVVDIESLIREGDLNRDEFEAIVREYEPIAIDYASNWDTNLDLYFAWKDLVKELERDPNVPDSIKAKIRIINDEVSTDRLRTNDQHLEEQSNKLDDISRGLERIYGK